MRKQGSITVFAAMCLMLIGSFLFALLEAGYVHGLNSVAKVTAELGIESVFAEYQPVLWQKYGILALDGSYGTQEFSIDYVTGAYLEVLQDNLDCETVGSNLFSLEVCDVSCTEYQLLTDEKGSVFLRAMAVAMKEKIPDKVLQGLKQQYEQNQQTESNSEAKDGVESGLAAVEEAKGLEEKQENTVATGETTASSQTEEISQTTESSSVPESSQMAEPLQVEETIENPLELVRELKQMAVLGLVVPDLDAVSQKAVDSSDSVSNRELMVGTSASEVDSSFTDKLLAVEYCGEILSCFCNPADDNQLSYELEYVLCGKDSDRANLESSVERLLLLREAANFCSISLDTKKKAEALATATSLAGASANPPIVRAVQVGVMAAWAFVESVLDIRALLAGDAISFLKNSNEWTTDTADMMQTIRNGAKAKHCEKGFSYQDYIKQLLWTKGKKQLSYRVMDLLEKQIQSAGYSGFAMDHLITEMTCRSGYQARNRFSPLTVVGHVEKEGYYFQRTNDITYLP